MDGGGQVERRRSLKERLGLKGMGCCGAHCGFGPPTISVQGEDEEESPLQELPIELINVSPTPAAATALHGCVGQSQEVAGMNLATALAAERQYRAAQDSDGGVSPIGREPSNVTVGTAPGTPFRVSLMRLLHETDGEDLEGETVERERGVGLGCDSVCCVCMGRKKGAAFIPCGHTFCRVCSREMWLHRGSCPICNRLILEILDIF